MFNPDQSLNGPLLADLSEIISKRIGLNFPEERWSDLVRSIQAASYELGFHDANSCIKRLLSAPVSKKEIEILAGHLTVGETYFFRDEEMFEALESHALSPLIKTRQEKDRFLNLWSAGCASGEEAYSLAILVKKMIPDLTNWRIVIQATDINPHLLTKARQGIYGDWSFRNTSPSFRHRYFTKTSDGRWELLPEIRQLVNFFHHNLAEDPYPSPADTANPIDIIVCRNVLMYFTQEKGKGVIHNFYRCLGSGGWLVVSPWETPNTLVAGFAAVRFPDAILYQKAIQGVGTGKQGFSPAEHGRLISNTIVASQEKRLTKTGGKRGNKGEERNSQAGHDRVYQPRPPTPNPRPQTPDPRSPILETHEDLARHYANMGMLPEAMEHCQRAISRDELNPALYYLLASIHQERGQIEEAIKSLKRVLYLDPDFILASFALGNLNAIQGKFKDAEKYFGNALHLLEKINKEDLLPESGGLTAGGLVEIIHSVRRRKNHGPGNLERDLFGR